jgi:hypothetical protein
MDERGRSTEDILRDIAREEENLSRTAHQIGDRIKEKLDLSEYVKDSPYWAMGIASGVGFLVARVLQPRTTPMERIMSSLADEIGGSLGGLRISAAGPRLAGVTLLGFGAKLAAGWINNAISTSGSSGCVRPPLQAEGDSTIYPNASM